MKLIDMNFIHNDMTMRIPGIQTVGTTVYLIVPEDITPKGCTRMFDRQNEVSCPDQYFRSAALMSLARMLMSKIGS